MTALAPAAAPVFTDFGGLAALRSAARADETAALAPVAKQFESLFVHMMLKAMRDATPRDGLLNSHHSESYEQMYDQQLAMELSDHGGLGLARVLIEQLQGRVSGGVDAAGDSVPGALAAPGGIPRSVPPPQWAPGPPATALAPAARPPLATAAERPARRPDSPEDFVAMLWEVAQPAAAELGVDPAVLIAQAALETGWGRRTLPAAGDSSFNLFNIKAGKRWAGPTTTVTTVEYRDGVARREAATFRVYDSVASSFADYVSLISEAPRYQNALARVDDPQGYLEELQQAGYATDPQYASKIMAILQRPQVAAAIDALKNSANPPLTG